jgi:hypothetical protein
MLMRPGMRTYVLSAGIVIFFTKRADIVKTFTNRSRPTIG